MRWRAPPDARLRVAHKSSVYCTSVIESIRISTYMAPEGSDCTEKVIVGKRQPSVVGWCRIGSRRRVTALPVSVSARIFATVLAVGGTY